MSVDFRNYDYTYLAKDQWLLGQDQEHREIVYRQFFLGFSADQIAEDHFMVDGTLDDTEKFIVKYLYILGVSELYAKQKVLTSKIDTHTRKHFFKVVYGDERAETFAKVCKLDSDSHATFSEIEENALALEKAVFLDAMKDKGLKYANNRQLKKFKGLLSERYEETKCNVYLLAKKWVDEIAPKNERQVTAGKSKSIPETVWKLWTEQEDVYGDDTVEWINFGVLSQVSYTMGSRGGLIAITNETGQRLYLRQTAFRRVLGAELSKEEADDAFAEAYSAANNLIDQEIAVLMYISGYAPDTVFEIAPASVELDSFHPVAGSVEKLEHYKKTGEIHQPLNVQGSIDLDDIALELKEKRKGLKKELELKTSMLAEVDVDIAEHIQHYNDRENKLALREKEVSLRRDEIEKEMHDIHTEIKRLEDHTANYRNGAQQVREKLKQEIAAAEQEIASTEATLREANFQLQKIDDEVEKITSTAVNTPQLQSENDANSDDIEANIAALPEKMQIEWFRMKAEAAAAQRDAAKAEQSAQYFEIQAERRANLSDDDRRAIAEAFLSEQKDPNTERAKKERQNTIDKLSKWAAQNKLYGIQRPIKFNGKKTLANLQQRAGIPINKQGNLEVRITGPYYANEDDTETDAFYVDFIKHNKTGIVVVVLGEDNKTLIAKSVLNEHPKWVKHQDKIVGADQTNYDLPMQQRLEWHKEISEACARDT